MDFDHPQTPHVAAASRQLDLILDYCKRITLLSDAGERRFMLEVVRPAFVALRWLAANRFPDHPHIADGLSELERLTEQLVELPLLHPGRCGAQAIQCPACGGKPTRPDRFSPAGHCSSCLKVIMPGLDRVQSCEEGFGTDAI